MSVNVFRDRAKRLARSGAQPWRAAPKGAIAGYDQNGHVLTRLFGLCAAALLLVVVGVLVIAQKSGYAVVTPEEARGLMVLKEKIGARPLRADELQAFVSISPGVHRTVAELVRGDLAGTENEQGQLAPTWSPDPSRVRALHDVVRWSASQGKNSATLVSRLREYIVAAEDPDVAAGFRAVLEVPAARRKILFGGPGEFDRIYAALDDLLRDSADIGFLNQEISRKRQQLRSRRQEASLLNLSAANEIGRVERDIAEIQRRLGRQRAALDRCYKGFFVTGQ
jgi:hypothetical protein